MLYLVATPIGNLKDFSFRAVETLKACAYILCEDTRHSQTLLQAYGIEVPLKSYHAFNEKKREEEIVEDLKAGLSIALISDAGTPGICDPGEELVKKCYEEGLAVTALPGASALTAALSLCPFEKKKSQFLGFFPTKQSEERQTLAEILTFRGVSIFYEAPHRVVDTLRLIEAKEPTRLVALFRELTKKFETMLVGSATTLLSHFQGTPPRGEIVLAISPPSEDDTSLDPRAQILHLQEQFDLPLAEAIKVAAELRGVPKKELYTIMHQK